MSDKLLLDLAHELGLPMRGRINGTHVGWSRDRDACIALYRMGASVTRVTSRYGGEEWSGYDVSFPVGKLALPREGAAT